MSKLSVIITSRGNLSHLKKCLISLEHLEIKPIEVIVLSREKISLSIDTLEIRFVSDLTMTFSEMKKKIISEIQGDWILFLDEKCSLHFKYAEVLREIFLHPKIELFSGPMIGTKNQPTLDYAKSVALSSPLCSGISFPKYRSLGHQLVSTGEEKIAGEHFWVKKSLLEESMFSSAFAFSGESYLIQEIIKKAVGSFYHPKLIAWSYSDYRMKDFFYKGFFRSKLLRNGKKISGDTYWLPMTFIVVHILFILNRPFFYQVFFMYLSLVGVVSFGLSVKAKKVWIAPLVLLYHYLIVVFYGFGFLKERLKIK